MGFLILFYTSPIWWEVQIMGCLIVFYTISYLVRGTDHGVPYTVFHISYLVRGTDHGVPYSVLHNLLSGERYRSWGALQCFTQSPIWWEVQIMGCLILFSTSPISALSRLHQLFLHAGDPVAQLYTQSICHYHELFRPAVVIR